MPMSRDLYEQAYAKIQQHRAQAVIDARVKHEIYKETHGEYAKVMAELSQTGAELAKRIFAFGMGSADIDDIKEKNLALQKRAAELLARDGLTPDAFEPEYDCMLCRDTGRYNGEACECIKELMKKEAFRRLNDQTPLELCSFDTFRLTAYPEKGTMSGISPRVQMEKVLAKCKKYAEEFDKSSPSLLLQGGVGLGKTHLSLAIARRVIERGYNVVYGSAQDFLTRIENEKFGRDKSDNDTLSLLKQCDLLILDDLGTEFSTGFTVSVIYDVINNRLRSSMPTIISTNLGLEALSKRYEERVVSRITGEYVRIPFIGSDVRFVLRKSHGGSVQQ